MGDTSDISYCHIYCTMVKIQLKNPIQAIDQFLILHLIFSLELEHTG